jgi:hypothetical protein
VTISRSKRTRAPEEATKALRNARKGEGRSTVGATVSSFRVSSFPVEFPFQNGTLAALPFRPQGLPPREPSRLSSCSENPFLKRLAAKSLSYDSWQEIGTKTNRVPAYALTLVQNVSLAVPKAPDAEYA